MEEWFFEDVFYEAQIKYDLSIGQLWLQCNRASPMGHRAWFVHNPVKADDWKLYFLYPYFRSP